MRNRREAVLLATLLITLIGIALFVRPHAARTSTDDTRATTFRYGPAGAAALYHLMDELDIPVRRLLRPWTGDTAPGVVIVLAPVQRATPAELQALRTWIEGGGTLIYVPAPADGIAASLGLHTRGLRPDTLPPLQAVRWNGVPAFPLPHAWSAGIDSVPGFRSGFSARSTAPRQEGAQVLLRTADNVPTAVLVPFGAGRVLAFSDAAALSNAHLRDGGAALLFTRAVISALGDSGTVRFDEFHQGYREASAARTIVRFLTQTGTGRALLQAALACLLLLLLYGARFGAPLDPPAGRRRSQLEHVQALASGYQRAGARRTARRLLLHGMERRLGRRVRGHSDALPAAALDGSHAGRRLKQQWERGEEADLVELTAAIDDFVAEVRQWK